MLLIGGSEGGLASTLEAGWLAAHGFPTLAIAYFKSAGLPAHPAGIPLEYFARALRWLAHQPHVDPRRLLTLGASRGSEAALLLGAHYPTLVHAVIALAPSDAAICSYPGCTGPAWTLRGRALPFTRQFDNPYPADAPAAIIPAERIRGPLLLACGGADQVWVSCAYARAIIRRLAAHHDKYRHVLYAYPNAGHAIGFFVPNEPSADRNDASFVADQRDRPTVWKRLLAFLVRL